MIFWKFLTFYEYLQSVSSTICCSDDFGCEKYRGCCTLLSYLGVANIDLLNLLKSFLDGNSE